MTEDGVPLLGAQVFFDADPGLGIPASATTDPQGIAAIGVRPGLLAASYSATARVVDALGNVTSVSFSASGTEPATGTLFTPVATGHSVGQGGIPGPASLARIGKVGSVAAGSDGSIWLSDLDADAVYRVSPEGHLTRVAGGNGAGSAGDTGPATSAQLNNPYGLLADVAAGRLYIADTYNNRVRYVDLATGVIMPFAGTGAYGTREAAGDGGPATSAQLKMPRYLAQHPSDRSIWISELTGELWVRRVDAVSGTITSPLAQAPGGTASHLQSCSNFGCGIAWSGDVLYVSGDFHYAGYQYGSNCAIAAWDGTSFTRVLGPAEFSGYCATSDGATPLLSTSVGVGALAVDAQRNLHYAEINSSGNGTRVRRFSLDTPGPITTVVGDSLSGYAGDFVATPGGRLGVPREITFMPGGHLLVADETNACVRAVW